MPKCMRCGRPAAKRRGRHCTSRWSRVRIQGKRRTVLGNLSLAFAYALEKNLSVRKTEKKHGRVNKIFNFLADIGPNREYALLLHFQESTVLCRLQCSEEFADALRLRLGSQDCTETPRNPDKA